MAFGHLPRRNKKGRFMKRRWSGRPHRKRRHGHSHARGAVRKLAKTARRGRGRWGCYRAGRLASRHTTKARARKACGGATRRRRRRR